MLRSNVWMTNGRVSFMYWCNFKKMSRLKKKSYKLQNENYKLNRTTIHRDYLFLHWQVFYILQYLNLKKFNEFQISQLVHAKWEESEQGFFGINKKFLFVNPAWSELVHSYSNRFKGSRAWLLGCTLDGTSKHDNFLQRFFHSKVNVKSYAIANS